MTVARKIYSPGTLRYLDKIKDIVSGDLGNPILKEAGAYIITHVKSGHFYIGSSKNFYKRLSQHINVLQRNIHHSRILQKLFDDDPKLRVEFYLTGIHGCDDNIREKAFDLEQELLDIHKSNPLLVNASKNSRESISVYNTSEKHRNRNKEVHTGKILSDITKAKISKASKKYYSRIPSSERLKTMLNKRHKKESIQKIREWSSRLMRKVSIDGIIYDSLREAGRIFQIDKTSVRQRCESEKYPTWYFI